MNDVLNDQIAPEILQAIIAQATASGLSVNDYLRGVLGLTFQAPNGTQTITDALLDWEYIAECAAEADPSITLEMVRDGLSSIPGSMTEDFRRERDER